MTSEALERKRKTIAHGGNRTHVAEDFMPYMSALDRSAT